MRVQLNLASRPFVELGPIYFRLLITRQQIDDEAIERTIDTLMRAWST